MSHALFDAIKAEKDITTDADLSFALGLSSAAQVNRYRHRHDPITAALILRIYDFTGFSIEKIRALAADTVTPAVKPTRSTVARVSRKWNPVASFQASAADAPQYVSRVHRCM